MTTEHQQNQAIDYALGTLSAAEKDAFETCLRNDVELLEFSRSVAHAADAVALSAPPLKLPEGLRASVMHRIDAEAMRSSAADIPPPSAASLASGLDFLMAAGSTGWKQLPIPGAWIKMLSLQRERGYAVLLGKLDPGTRYPAHVNVGPEDFYVLTGDLHIGETALHGGDFHHAEAGSWHDINHSETGCTLLAVLTIDDPLVALAMA